MERFKRLITRDGIKSELQPMHEMRPKISTVLKGKNAGTFIDKPLSDLTDTFEEREYQYRRTVTIEIYEYEEI